MYGYVGDHGVEVYLSLYIENIEQKLSMQNLDANLMGERDSIICHTLAQQRSSKMGITAVKKPSCDREILGSLGRFVS